MNATALLHFRYVRIAFLFAVASLFVSFGSAWSQDHPAPIQRPVANPDGLYFNVIYDEAADPAEILRQAVVVTSEDKRNILIEVGGDWCVWCQILDRYLADYPAIRADFRKSFLIVKVNYSRDNPNEEFLRWYPDVAGYPHFFVLDSFGDVLASQDTAKLEKGDSYNDRKMKAFARKWRSATSSN